MKVNNLWYNEAATIFDCKRNKLEGLESNEKFGSVYIYEIPDKVELIFSTTL
jgi:hypothetical protein